MPWTIADVKRYRKGLTPKQSRQWLHVANQSLATCIANGGTDKTCAPIAIRKANGVVKEGYDPMVKGIIDGDHSISDTLINDTLISEAGAVLNKENKSALRNAFATIRRVLASAGIDFSQPDTEDDSTSTDNAASAGKPAKEAIGGFSIADLGMALQAALMATQEAAPDEGYPTQYRILDIFDGYFVYTEGYSGFTCYSVDYEIAEDGSVTLGQPQLVVRKVTYVKPGASVSSTQESAIDRTLVDPRSTDGVFDWSIAGDTISVPLTESAIATDGSARIKLIDANRWGSTGFYSADVLARDGPIAFPAGTKMYIDHDTPAEEAQRPEGSIERLAATFTTAATYDNDPKYGAGLYARINVRDALRVDLDNIANWIGTSIRANGKAKIGEAQGKRGPIITQLTPSPLNRVDFVTIPGAGGKIIPLFESMRNRSQPIEAVTGDEQSIVDKGDQAMTDQELREAIAAGIKDAVTPLQDEIARLREANALRDAETIVRAHVKTIAGLPRAMADRVVPMIVREATIGENGSLDRAALLKRADEIIRGEASYYTAIGGSRIVGLGESASNDSTSATSAEDDQKEFAETFARWGLSEAAAKVAARGRTRA